MELKHSLLDKANEPGNELLIVPYGIETFYCYVFFINSFSFNRTLWN